MRYFLLTLKHKWFVLLAGWRLGGIPLWRLLIHDWSKFLPSELPHYNRQFFGKADDPYGFMKCWLHHQNHNPHHHEYWIPRSGHSRCDPPYPDNKPISMPRWAVREMVADWMAAGRAYEGRWPDFSNWKWLAANLDRVCEGMARTSQRHLRDVLMELGAFPQPCDYRGAGNTCSRAENAAGMCLPVRHHDGWQGWVTNPACPFGGGKLWQSSSGSSRKGDKEA